MFADGILVRDHVSDWLAELLCMKRNIWVKIANIKQVMKLWLTGEKKQLTTIKVTEVKYLSAGLKPTQVWRFKNKNVEKYHTFVSNINGPNVPMI